MTAPIGRRPYGPDDSDTAPVEEVSTLPPVLQEPAGYWDEWITLDDSGVAHFAQDERQARSRSGHRVFRRTNSTTSWEPVAAYSDQPFGGAA